MGIAWLVAILMVLTMLRHPINRLALKTQAAKECQHVFQSTRTLERPMSEQAVVAYANSQPATDLCVAKTKV